MFALFLVISCLPRGLTNTSCDCHWSCRILRAGIQLSVTHLSSCSCNCFSAWFYRQYHQATRVLLNHVNKFTKEKSLYLVKIKVNGLSAVSKRSKGHCSLWLCFLPSGERDSDMLEDFTVIRAITKVSATLKIYWELKGLCFTKA